MSSRRRSAKDCSGIRPPIVQLRLQIELSFPSLGQKFNLVASIGRRPTDKFNFGEKLANGQFFTRTRHACTDHMGRAGAGVFGRGREQSCSHGGATGASGSCGTCLDQTPRRRPQVASALGFGAKREWGSILGSCQKAQPAEITQKGAATRPLVTCGQRLLALGATDGGEHYGCCK